MQNQSQNRLNGWTTFAVVGAVVLLLFSVSPSIYRPLRRAELAESLNNVKQVKYALDGFAADHNGNYPNRSIGMALGQSRFESSNDYFRQLFLSGETSSEMIFWARNSPVANPDPPDDVIGPPTRRPNPSVILEPGDVHWAYVTERANTSDVSLPLLLDPFLPGTTDWDPKRRDGNVVVLRIDGSATAMRLNKEGRLINHYDGSDLLPPRVDPTSGSTTDPARLLVQPDPPAP